MTSKLKSIVGPLQLRGLAVDTAWDAADDVVTSLKLHGYKVVSRKRRKKKAKLRAVRS